MLSAAGVVGFTIVLVQNESVASEGVLLWLWLGVRFLIPAKVFN